MGIWCIGMKVSVVMPAYNAEQYIEVAIRSVLGQSWRELELIVVDDGSRDGTAEIVERLAEEDGRITLLRNAENAGVSASRNRGVREAHGEWIAFLDSDDLWRADKLERQLALAGRHPEAVLSYTASAFMDESGRMYSYVMEAEEETTYKTLLRKNLISCSSVMVRRDVMLRHPMGGDRMHEDYAAWLEILREGRCAYGLNEPLLVYRLRQSSKSGRRLHSAGMLYRSYRYVGYSALCAAAMTLRYAVHSIEKRKKICRAGRRDGDAGTGAFTQEEGNPHIASSAVYVSGQAEQSGFE